LLNKWRDRLEAVNVDSIGIGDNFGMHLGDLGFPVQLINVSESSRNSKRFLNLKADWFWSLRERFQQGQVKGLSDERTISQLAQIRYKLNPRGQTVIESKEELLRRGVKSQALAAVPPATSAEMGTEVQLATLLPETKGTAKI
jgi:hypothetical protein